MNSIKLFKSHLYTSLKGFILVCVVVFGTDAFGQSKRINVNHFDKVIISPHIQINFVEGTEESVTIESNKVTDDKVTIEVKGKTLRIYLDDAKIVTKSEKQKEEWKGKREIYKGTIITATVTYKTISELSLRGDETFVFESPIVREKFRLNIYGGSKIYLNNVDLKALYTTMYGESYLELKKGTVVKQRITCYGEGEVNATNIQKQETKVTAYGEGHFNLNVSENLKVTAYGEVVVNYKGNPIVNKGIVIGEATISKI